MLFFVNGCKDEDIELVPEWESAINGFAQLPAAKSFVYNEPDVAVDVNLRWISIDNKAAVEKVEVYLLFDEPYIDVEGNPSVASHGADEDGENVGRLFRTFEGSEVPGNREDVSFSISQEDVYNLYSDAVFDYDEDDTATPVFDNPDKPERDDVNRVLPGDNITVRWEFTATDGRVFYAWSPSVCTEFPGSNCQVSFTSICLSELEGTFDYETTDIQCDNCGGSVPGPAGCGSSVTGSGTLETLGGGQYALSDATFGMYGCAWDDDPATGVTLRDVCEKVSFGGSDQYGLLYTFTIVSNDGNTLTIDWSNDYGDSGRSALTRTDGKTWPLTLYN